MNEVNLGTTVYDINKAMYQQTKSISIASIEENFKKIFSWFKTQALWETQYYMFLCRERNDYTIFNFIKNNPKKGIEELKNLIDSRGNLKDIIYNKNYNYYEFWISICEDDIPEKYNSQEYMFILFPCNEFVIEIGD